MASLIKRAKRYQVVVRYERRAYKVPGYLLDATGKRLTEELGRNLEKLLQSKALGNIAPDLRRYIECLPVRIRRSMAAQGLIDASQEGKSLVEHVQDYREAMAQKGNTEGHVKTTIGAILDVVEFCGFRMMGDVNAAKIRAYLASRREPVVVKDPKNRKPILGPDKKPITKAGISSRRHNAIITAWGGFFRWCLREHRAYENPIINVPRLNERVDKRHKRRAMAVQEVLALLDATERGSYRSGMTGAERALLYRVAMETGLRLNELKTLTRGCVDLEDGSLTVRAAYSKHRREDVLPMRPALVVAITEHLKHKSPKAKIFNMPSRYAMLRTFYADLHAAGVKRADDAGRVVDFHAMRHTFISSLCNGGVHPKVAQELARHSTITLTMDNYSHTLHGAGSDALLTMPDYDKKEEESAAKTGTTDSDLQTGAQTGALLPGKQIPRRTKTDKPKEVVQKQENPINTGENPVFIGNAGGGSRTHTSVRTQDFESSAIRSQPTTPTGVKNTINPSGVQTGNFTKSDDKGLSAVVTAWADLPEHVRATIANMVAMFQPKLKGNP